MFELIERLRQKPDRTKKQIAFLVAFALSGLIFVIWLSVIYPEWREGQMRETKVENLEKSPTYAISETFSDGFRAVGEQFGKIKDAVSSFSAEPTYYSATTTTNIKTETKPEPKFLELD